MQVNVTGIGVQADLRLIKADTGEVIWQKLVIGKKTQKQYSVGVVKVGSNTLSNEMYAAALDDAAEVIANALIEDVEASNFFVK